MNQQYVQVVRACKTIVHHLPSLDDTLNGSQRKELVRLLLPLLDAVGRFIEEDGFEADGKIAEKWIGEEKELDD